MTESNSKRLGLMPKLVVVLGILLVAAGGLWHGISGRFCGTRGVRPSFSGMTMDVIYQFKTFYPAQALLIALLLAFIPYLLILRAGHTYRALVARQCLGQNPVRVPTCILYMPERVCLGGALWEDPA